MDGRTVVPDLLIILILTGAGAWYIQVSERKREAWVKEERARRTRKKD